MNLLTDLENRILLGDCLEVLKTIPSDSIDAVVTDPPYGIGSKDPTVEEIIRYLQGSRLDTGGDFMNAEWDIPSVHVWKECFRVLKHGGYALSCASTRTWDIMSLGLRAAGFEDRDSIASMFGPSVLCWVQCLTEDTEALTESGWKKYHEIQVGDKVACWDPSTEKVFLGPVQNLFQSNWEGQMSVFRNDDIDCVVTPNHRVFHKSYERQQVQYVRNGAYSPWQAKEAGEISRTKKIKIPMSGYCDGPGAGGLDYVQLAGWVWTEGGFDDTGSGVRIYQSETANPENVQVIDDLLARMGVAHSRYDRERVWTYKGSSRPYTEICWYISGEEAARLRMDLPDKVPSWCFIWNMTLEERKVFFTTCMAGDGNAQACQFYQKGEEPLSRFQAFLATMGYTGKVYMRPDRPGQGHVNVRTKSSTELTIRNLQFSVDEYYKGTVWCLEVPTGAFVVRRNGHTFITGNSQGFPKSLNISKAILKIEGLEKAEELAKLWKGFGTALKPAWEPILSFRRPMGLDHTVAEQVVASGTGGMNIDGARVRHSSPEDLKAHQDMVATLKAKGGKLGNSWKNSSDLSGANEVNQAGRWPSNVLLTHSPGCRQVGTRKMSAPVINRFDDGMKPFGHGAGHAYTSTPTGDADGNEDVPIYDCVSNCPVRVLNVLSEDTHEDISRVFAQFVPEAPFFYAPKASRKERNEGLDVRKSPKPKDGIRITYFRLKEGVEEDVFMRIQEVVNDQTETDAHNMGVAVEKVTPVDVESFSFERLLFEHLIPESLREHFEIDDTVGGNDHPTVKPISLMRYLVRLVTPKGGVVLDPYCGSGTTCLAAMEEGMRFIGIEKDSHFHDIAYRRVAKRSDERVSETKAEELHDLMSDLPQE